MNKKQKLQAEIEVTKMLLDLLKNAPESVINEVLNRLSQAMKELKKIEEQEQGGE